MGRRASSVIVSHELPLSEGPDAYKHFDARVGGWTKVILKPLRNGGNWRGGRWRRRTSRGAGRDAPRARGRAGAGDRAEAGAGEEPALARENVFAS